MLHYGFMKKAMDGKAIEKKCSKAALTPSRYDCILIFQYFESIIKNVSYQKLDLIECHICPF